MDNNTTITVLGIAGSLRSSSYNKAVLYAAQKLAPKEMIIHSFEGLGDIPPFNQDEESNPPESVKEFKRSILSADAILFVTPEYNYSVPGVLKNAIDWASRPYGQNAFNGKPVAVMGASIGMIGTARAQYHLRQTCVFLNMFPLNAPEVMIGMAQEKIDDRGTVTDEHTKEKITELLHALMVWTRNLNEFKQK